MNTRPAPLLSVDANVPSAVAPVNWVDAAPPSIAVRPLNAATTSRRSCARAVRRIASENMRRHQIDQRVGTVADRGYRRRCRAEIADEGVGCAESEVGKREIADDGVALSLI